MRTYFPGIGTRALFAHLLADLFAEAYEAAASAARKLAAARRERATPHPCAASGKRVTDALRDAVESGRLKVSTAAKYRNVLAHFITALGRTDLTAVTPVAVEKFLEQRAALEVGRGGRRVDLCALRTVLDRLLGQESTAGLHYPHRPEPVEAATRGQVTTLLAAAEDDRDRILVLMLNAMDLRPGQIVAVRTEHIRLAEKALVLPHGRPGTRSFAPIPDELAALLGRALRQGSSREWLFSSDRHPDRPVTVRALQKRLARIAARCGLEVTCTALHKAESICRSADHDNGDDTPQQPKPHAPDAGDPLPPARIVVSVSVIPRESPHNRPARHGAGTPDEPEASATPRGREEPFTRPEAGRG